MHKNVISLAFFLLTNCNIAAMQEDKIARITVVINHTNNKLTVKCNPPGFGDIAPLKCVSLQSGDDLPIEGRTLLTPLHTFTIPKHARATFAKLVIPQIREDDLNHNSHFIKRDRKHKNIMASLFCGVNLILEPVPELHYMGPGGGRFELGSMMVIRQNKNKLEQCFRLNTMAQQSYHGQPEIISEEIDNNAQYTLAIIQLNNEPTLYNCQGSVMACVPRNSYNCLFERNDIPNSVRLQACERQLEQYRLLSIEEKQLQDEIRRAEEQRRQEALQRQLEAARIIKERADAERLAQQLIKERQLDDQLTQQRVRIEQLRAQIADNNHQ
jgi:hypothetical protein